jgi:hypothetical protein
VFVKVRLQGRTGEKGVKFVPKGEGTVGTATVGVWKIRPIIRFRGGIVMMGGKGDSLTTETK